MAAIRHRVGIKSSARSVYDALTQPTQLVGWWASAATGFPAAGQQLVLHFADLAQVCFQVLGLVPDSRVKLKCASGPTSWVGSELHVNLEPANDQVFVTLDHVNVDPADPSYLYFSTKWPVYLLSLKSFLETGRGTPYPKEPKIHLGD
jgi:uncharacterized protein YndB with AHSA1/START domain